MLKTIDELRACSRECRAAGKRVGLVPTMGALHEGHLSLVRAAQDRCDTTIVSIFVNPTQFGPDEDFHRYPRPLENDLRLLETAGRPEVFVPSVEEMYPAGFDASVHIGGVTEVLEGAARPTHFDGVATVVLKLFQAAEADFAFFGQKDFQQACMVRKMVADLNLPVEIVVCPIVREPDGLAMSSRNRYLSPEHRRRAPVLFQSLEEARRLIMHENVRDPVVVCESIRAKIAMVPEFQIDYAVLADPVTLKTPPRLDPETTSEIVVLLAAKIGSTRLIDNAIIPLVPNSVR